jgi:AbrB family looped-hinge helix DNA binding protein
MRITAKGQVTIPQPIRRQLGLHPSTEVEFEVAGNAVRIRKASGKSGRGQRIVGHLTGRGGVRLSTDEIMALTRR